MALTRRDPDPVTPSDYYGEGEQEAERPTPTTRVLHGLQLVLIVVLALLSFAVFWVIGLMLNMF